MHVPSQEQWQKVIDTLKGVLPLAKYEENFNINIGIVQHEPCGTVCCVGGWYRVAKATSHEIRFLINCEWAIGKEEIALDLGFENGECLKAWAADNKELWGNEDGYGMFLDANAWNSGVKGAQAKTLADVIRHFEFVKKQCYAYPNQTTVANGN